MGQKTNPNILRIGNIKEWKSKYIAKKSTESSTIMFRDLEIKKFIFQLFAKNELKIQNCRVYYSESSLHVYVSYYSSFNALITNQQIKSKYIDHCSKLFRNKILKIKKNTLKKQFYLAKAYKKTFLKQSQINLFQNDYFLNKKTQRSESINNFKTYKDIINHKTINRQNPNLFISKILKSLILFTNKKHHVFQMP